MKTPGSVLIAHFDWLYFGRNLSLDLKIRKARHCQPRPPGAAPIYGMKSDFQMMTNNRTRLKEIAVLTTIHHIHGQSSW